MRHLHKAWDTWTKRWPYGPTDHRMRSREAATLYWVALSMSRVLVCLHWLHGYELRAVMPRIGVYNSWESSCLNSFLLSSLALNFRTIAIHSGFSSVPCRHTFKKWSRWSSLISECITMLIEFVIFSYKVRQIFYLQLLLHFNWNVEEYAIRDALCQTDFKQYVMCFKSSLSQKNKMN